MQTASPTTDEKGPIASNFDPFGARDLYDKDIDSFKDEDGDPSPDEVDKMPEKAPEVEAPSKNPEAASADEKTGDTKGEEPKTEAKDAEKDSEKAEEELEVKSLKDLEMEKKAEAPKEAEKKTTKPGEQKDIRSLAERSEEADETDEGDDSEGGVTYNLSDLSEEELASAIDDILKSMPEGGAEPKSTGKSADKASQSAQKDLQKALETSNEMGAIVKQAKRELVEKSQELETLRSDYDSLQSTMEVLTPYKEALSEHSELGEAVRYLAQSARSGDEAAKKKHLDKAIDNLYSFLEAQTGIDIRKAVDANAQQRGLPEERTGKGGDVNVTQKAGQKDDVSILKGITF